LSVAGYLLLAMFVGIVLSILFTARRTRPPPPQHLSDSAGSAQFAAARRDEEARGRR
jgi:uncharacterized membrane protein affecting hemolysin expression